MHLAILADVTVSTGFLVLSYIAITAVALVVFVSLFGPGPRYKIATTHSEDNTSAEFLHVLESLTDSAVHYGTTLTVLTNGDQFYEEELRAITAA